jgi:hypothetical protein
MSRSKSQVQLAPGGAWRLKVADLPVVKEAGPSKTFRIELANAPKPPRQYVADVAWFLHRADHSVLGFGQRGLTKSVRTSVSVAISPHTAGKITRESREGLHSFLEFLERSGVEPLDVAAPQTEPEQAVLLRANMMTVAQQQHEAVLDFFNASPASARDMHKTGYLEIEPVVRIELSTALLAGLLGELFAYEGHFPAEEDL